MEREKPGSIVIDRIRRDGRPSRTRGWTERISTALATAGRDHSLGVLPCIIQGEKCLVVERNLAQTDPVRWDFILGFARDNGLRIQEDRRLLKRPMTPERRVIHI